MPFNPSKSQIIRRVFDSVNDAFMVNLFRDSSRTSEALSKLSLLEEIVKELKIINLYLAEISNIEVDEPEK